MRISDVSLMLKSAVNVQDQSISLVPHKTRAIKPDTVEMPIDNDTWPAVVRMLNDHQYDPSPYMFPLMHSHYCSKKNFLVNQFSRMCDGIGLPDHTFHCFRHSFITRMLEGGMDSLMISAITGLDVKQISTYAHIGLDAKRRAVHAARLNLAQKGKFTPQAAISVVEAA